jgi:imidazolonepropionase
MPDTVDVLIHSARQVCTMPTVNGGPQRGEHLGTLGVMDNGAVAIKDGRIAAVGPSDEIRANCPAAEDRCQCRIVISGFVDPHSSRLVGDRA